MANDEMTEHTLLSLLRDPLEVPDAGFAQRVLQHLPTPEPTPLDRLWPAWLFAAAGGAWLGLKEGIALPPQLQQTWQALRDGLHQLGGQIASVDLAEVQGSTLWIPMALVLVLLVTLMQLVED